MRYAYACRACGTEIVAHYPMGEAEPFVPCTRCPETATRDYSSVQLNNGDPFRLSWLSTRKTDEKLAKQKRPLDPLAPKDMFDAREVHKRTGRLYIGDNVDMLNPRARDAIVNDAGNLRADKKYDRELIKNGNGLPKTYNPLPEPPPGQHPFGDPDPKKSLKVTEALKS